MDFCSNAIETFQKMSIWMKNPRKVYFSMIINGGGQIGGHNKEFEKRAGKVAIFKKNLAVFHLSDLETLKFAVKEKYPKSTD